MSFDQRTFSYLRRLKRGGLDASAYREMLTGKGMSLIEDDPRGTPAIVHSVVRSIVDNSERWRSSFRSESNRRLWEASHGPIKAEAARLWALDGYDAALVFDDLDRFARKWVASYRAQPGCDCADDDHEGVIKRRVEFFASKPKLSRPRKAKGPARPAATRAQRGNLAWDVQCTDAMDKDARADQRRRFRGLSSRVVTLHGERVVRRGKSGLRSVTQMLDAIGTQRRDAVREFLLEEERNHHRLRPRPLAKPDIWGVRLTESAVATACVKERGKSHRQAKIEAIPRPNVRHMIGIVDDIAPKQGIVWTWLDSLSALMRDPVPGMKAKHRALVRNELEAAQEAGVGIRYRIVGERVYLRNCGRPIPVDPTAGRKKPVRFVELQPGLAHQRRGLVSTDVGQLADTYLHAVAGAGRTVVRMREHWHQDSEVLFSMMGHRTLGETYGYLKTMNAEPGDGVATMAFLIDEFSDASLPIHRPVLDLWDAIKRGGLGEGWRHLASGAFMQRCMDGKSRDFTFTWREVEGMGTLLDALSADLTDPENDEAVLAIARAFNTFSRSGMSSSLTLSERRIRDGVGGGRKRSRPAWTRAKPPPAAPPEPHRIAVGQSRSLAVPTGGRPAPTITTSFADVGDDGLAF